ncbi:hypothetical protein [Kitasatospora indigofera]|uniref:hypothetical protein n=1 Tax=Kitasatospora indigofera TaxID=67307 RepID=UPI0036C6EED9
MEVTVPCAWLCLRFPPSFRDTGGLTLQREVVVSRETVRRRRLKFGQASADGLRRPRVELAQHTCNMIHQQHI